MHILPVTFSTVIALALLSGCANREGVAPSQNSSLNAVSPSGTATSEGGYMQRSLDGWLKEEWTPLTEPTPSVTKTTASDGTIIETKTEVIPTTITASDGKVIETQTTHVITTKTTPEGKVTTTTATAPVAAESVDETPFTLQKYVDKWKVYNEKKEKMDAGKPKEPSHLDTIQSMPVIGK